MTSTRYAAEGAPLRQSKWASDEQFNQLINALLAAKRIALVEDPEMRALLWFVQAKSTEPGGIKRFADTLLELFPDRVGTPTMRKLRARGVNNISCDEGCIIRNELFHGDCLDFDLPGELSFYHNNNDILCVADGHLTRRKLTSTEKTKITYKRSDFEEAFWTEARKLDVYLREICLNPSAALSTPIWFDDLFGAIREYRTKLALEAQEHLADTSISKIIFENLNFCLRQRRMILIEGVPGISKTISTRSWCAGQSGQARYVEVPASSDEKGFFVAVARALGVANGLGYNVREIKLRVEEALRESGVMLVLDESQFLWPQYMRPRAVPQRMQWIKTICDAGTPIALVAHTEFSKWQQLYVEKTNWQGDQFERRLNRKVRLPVEYTESDLLNIARSLHPTGDRDSWRYLAAIAMASTTKRASAITETLASARDLALQAGRNEISFEDLKATATFSLPVDVIEHRKSKPGAALVQPPCRAAEAEEKDVESGGRLVSLDRTQPGKNPGAERIKMRSRATTPESISIQT